MINHDLHDVNSVVGYCQLKKNEIEYASKFYKWITNQNNIILLYILYYISRGKQMFYLQYFD